MNKQIIPAVGLGLVAGAAMATGAEPKMNVLFIMSDDMRTDWKIYGTPQMHTPISTSSLQKGCSSSTTTASIHSPARPAPPCCPDTSRHPR